jgi:hypothetical protein
MNPAQCDALDYIHFLVAAQKSFSCTEAARCQPREEGAPAHDAFTRLLRRQPLDTEALWQETADWYTWMLGSWSWMTPPWRSLTPGRCNWSPVIGVANIVG